jgi:hypothetical protein
MRILVVLITLGCFASALRAHEPPAYHLEVDIKEGFLECELLMWATNYEDWFGLDPAKLVEGEHLVRREHGERILDALGEVGPVWIDGVKVRPTIHKMRTFVNDVPYVGIKHRYRLLSPPRNIRWQWLRYRTFEGGFDAIEATLFFFPNEEDFYNLALSPEEPEYTWHAEIPLRPADIARAARPLVAPPPTLPIPVPAILGLIFASLMAFLSRRQQLWVPLLFLSLGGGLAAATWDRGRVDLPLGFERREELPSRGEAEQIFSDLHRNVYRAFDYEDPSAIYDALAESVEGAFLERLYDQIYAGLVLRDEGGAVAKIQGVSILETSLLPPPEPGLARFDVDARWQVRGVVEHFGHKHLRTNEYQARYSLAKHGEHWRIAAVEMKSQERVGNDEAYFERPGDEER